MAKQINLTATQINDRLAAVPNKADTSSVNASLALKADKTELTSGLAGKQATLVSGTNIKTINNQSILGSGNITIQGGGGGGASDAGSVSYDNTKADYPNTSIGYAVHELENKTVQTEDYAAGGSIEAVKLAHEKWDKTDTYEDETIGKELIDLAQKVTEVEVKVSDLTVEDGVYTLDLSSASLKDRDVHLDFSGAPSGSKLQVFGTNDNGDWVYKGEADIVMLGSAYDSENGFADAETTWGSTPTFDSEKTYLCIVSHNSLVWAEKEVAE